MSNTLTIFADAMYLINIALFIAIIYNAITSYRRLDRRCRIYTKMKRGQGGFIS